VYDKAVKKRFYGTRSFAYVQDGEIHLVHNYSVAFVEDCRQIEGRRWNQDTKTNSFPLSSAPSVRALADKYKISLPEEVLRYDDGKYFTNSGESSQVYRIENNLFIKFDYNPQMIEAIRMYVPTVKWESPLKAWRVDESRISDVLSFALKYNLRVSPELQAEAVQIEASIKEIHDASVATSAELEVPGIAVPLLPYQKAGVNYLRKVRRGILGDQPGLGKTAQAISTIVVENALPVVVVCPNTLKLNWEREVKKFFPHLRVSVLNGTKSVPIENSDVIVLNYDIASERIDDVMLHGYRSFIADESHAIKNGKRMFECPGCGASVRSNARRCLACSSGFEKPREKWSVKRTNAVMRLVKALPEDAPVLLLTGTPITSRPEELIPQLEAVGKLEAFGGAWRFKNRYAPKRNIATNTKELNTRLRELCFVRRTKADVYEELPELRNAVQHLVIDASSMSKYRQVEDDVIEYFAQRAQELAKEEGSDGTDAYWEKKLRLERVENLVRITALRNVVSEIKYETCVKWLEDFLEAGTEKVIIFAEHVEMVDRIYEKFSDVAVKVRGGVSVPDRQAAVDRFQNDPGCRIFVANMIAASEGLTLTAASDVVFCELGWTPAIHEQCASRCYGRANDLHGATAWYLLAPETIDEKIYELLDRKRKVVNSVTDGVDEELGGSVMDSLIRDLVERGRLR
jgi:SWI/SNF-related matrix-associated actin-dependent regulator of chromatin subfamily A-like protein 1